MDYTNIDTLHNNITSCRLCLEGGYQIESQPIFSGTQSARLMLIGQAPGISEDDLGYPFGGDAGARLFRWLAQAGWTEKKFRETCYITSVTKCFPGKAKSGTGDRVPSAAERKLCRTWLDAEMALVKPEVIVPVGGLAIKLFFDKKLKLAEIIGQVRFDSKGRQIVPLPHPSGASRWLNNPQNVGRVDQAIYHLRMIRIELGL